MSQPLLLAPCFRSALRKGILPPAVKPGRYLVRHSSTEPGKPDHPKPEVPQTSIPAKKKLPAASNVDLLTLKQPTSDPLEPANSKKAEDHVLKPLSRPMGLSIPPQPGQNSGIDTRTFQQKRDDFFNHDKHDARRKELIRQFAKPYYRDWSRLQFNKGKIFLAPARLIRADKALYFPNLMGTTLASPKDLQNTTSVAKGRISVVRVYTARWAEQQCNSWLEDDKLNRLLQEGKGVVQRIDINVEQNRMRHALVKWFLPGLKKAMPPEMHNKYFLIRRGFEEEYKHAIGMFNAAVGHIYLIDDMCRIRWGGSGDAQPDEKESLQRGIVKLVQELKDKAEAGDLKSTTPSPQAIAKFVAKIPSILA